MKKLFMLFIMMGSLFAMTPEREVYVNDLGVAYSDYTHYIDLNIVQDNKQVKKYYDDAISFIDDELDYFNRSELIYFQEVMFKQNEHNLKNFRLLHKSLAKDLKQIINSHYPSMISNDIDVQMAIINEFKKVLSILESR